MRVFASGDRRRRAKRLLAEQPDLFDGAAAAAAPDPFALMAMDDDDGDGGDMGRLVPAANAGRDIDDDDDDDGAPAFEEAHVNDDEGGQQPVVVVHPQPQEVDPVAVAATARARREGTRDAFLDALLDEDHDGGDAPFAAAPGAVTDAAAARASRRERRRAQRILDALELGFDPSTSTDDDGDTSTGSANSGDDAGNTVSFGFLLPGRSSRRRKLRAHRHASAARHPVSDPAAIGIDDFDDAAEASARREGLASALTFGTQQQRQLELSHQDGEPPQEHVPARSQHHHRAFPMPSQTTASVAVRTAAGPDLDALLELPSSTPTTAAATAAQPAADPRPVSLDDLLD
uniref:Uncharacterized protein n=1 Tax=Neobodo designis TaxID=312471 RepID=A0A7S1LY98_NEODS